MAADLDGELATIASSLRHHGAGVLVTRVASEAGPLGLDDLVARMSASAEPAVRDALIPLFLLRPDVAGRVASICSALDPAVAKLLKIRYTAAAALAALWRTRLKLERPLPDLFAEELGVPPPGADYGEPCLAALANVERRLGIERHATDVYRAAADLAIAAKGARKGVPGAPAR